MNCKNAEKILASLPSDYTIEMAYRNNDVLLVPEGQSYNTDKFIQFLQNVNAGISDCILITTFGIDGPATTSILQYNENTIIYTFDNSRFSRTYDIKSFIITRLFSETKVSDNHIVITYYAKTFNNINIPIFKEIIL